MLGKGGAAFKECCPDKRTAVQRQTRPGDIKVRMGTVTSRPEAKVHWDDCSWQDTRLSVHTHYMVHAAVFISVWLSPGAGIGNPPRTAGPTDTFVL